MALKCIICIISTPDDSKNDTNLAPELKELISQIVVKVLLKGYSKSEDEFLYCKVCVAVERMHSGHLSM